MRVHCELGRGFLEPVYQEALAREFDDRGIPYEREVELPVYYRGRVLANRYRVDFVCYRELLVELKALGKLTSTEEAQILNYLAASGKEMGLLLNFGASSLQFRRFLRPPKSLSSV